MIDSTDFCHAERIDLTQRDEVREVTAFAAGTLAGVLILPRASVILLLLGGILWIGGKRWTRELLFPVLFLFLMLKF